MAGLYEVRQVFTSGGMGLVYRVWHRDWNVELAVKSPRQEALARVGGAEAFIREAETWIDLGLHPHIVSCHYVRTVDDIPRVFAEYVAGGSLEDWISSRRLYAGDRDEVLARLLDVAVQVAWGLGYAHEQGLVHRDVKPANVLLTPETVAKVTDFGLASARPDRPVTVPDGSGRERQVSTAWMTPAYCSPEQADAAAQAALGVDPASRVVLTAATDVWSWALSLLDMFNATAKPDRYGQAAPAELERYLGGGPPAGIPAMPPDLANLIGECLHRDPEERPHDFDVIAARLTDIYKENTGHPYPRHKPKAAELLADSLNNKALSKLDLGREEEAETAWEQALETDPHHLETTYNYGLVRWRHRTLAEDQFTEQLDVARARRGSDVESLRLLGLFHRERGDFKEAITMFEDAARLAPSDSELRSALADTRRCADAGAHVERVLPGHRGDVTSIALAGDGRLALTGGTDGTLRLWDLSDGRQVALARIDEPGIVTSVAVSGDGHHAVCGATTGMFACVFTPGADREGQVRKLEQDSATVIKAVALTPKGGGAVSGSEDGDIRLWEVATGRSMRLQLRAEGRVPVFRDHGYNSQSRPTLEPFFDENVRLECSSVSSMALAQNVPLAAIADAPARRVLFCDMAEKTLVAVLDAHPDWITCVALSADGSFAFSGGSGGALYGWELYTPKHAVFHQLLGREITSVALTSDGALGVSGQDDGTVRLWDNRQRRCLQVIKAHDRRVSAVALTQNGLALSAAAAPVVRDLAPTRQSGDPVRVWAMPSPNGAAHSPFRLSRPRESSVLVGEEERVRQSVAAARRLLDAGDLAGAAAEICRARAEPGYRRHPELLRQWSELGLHGRRTSLEDAWIRRAVETDPDHDRPNGRGITSLAVTADGRGGLLACDDGLIARFDRVGELACVRPPVAPTAPGTLVAATPDGRLAVSGDADGVLRVWDGERAVVIREIPAHREPVTAVALAADGRVCLSAGLFGTGRVWDLDSGQQLRVLAPSSDDQEPRPSALSLSSTGLVAVISRDAGPSVSGGSVVQVWDVARQHCLLNLESGERVSSVALSADERRVLAGTVRGPVQVLDLGLGSVSVLEGHEAPVTSVSFAQDGRFALSGSWDGSMRVWDLSKLSCARVLGRAHGIWQPSDESSIVSVALTPDARLALCGRRDGVLQFWELDWSYEFPPSADWDAGALPFLEAFLTIHTPCGNDCLSRRGTPKWTDKDLEQLFTDLARNGYGWLREAGVRAKLEQLTAMRGKLRPN